MSRKTRIGPGAIAGTAILVAQIAAIAVARTGDARYFCWAPFDVIHEYRIRTWVGGRELGEEEIRERYRMSPAGFNPRMIAQVTETIAYVEREYRSAEGARTVVHYRINGGEPRTWEWPQP